MICVSIGRTRHQQMIAEHQALAAQGAELVELRLDYIGRSVDLNRLLKNRPTPVVVTCRPRNEGGRWQRSEEERLMVLRSAIASGVEYVDLEESVAASVPRYGKTKRIVSFHDFEGTPADLEAIPERLAVHDADIVKVAITPNSFADVIRMLRIMESTKVPFIGIAMGEIGILTRILAARYGAPFTYCTSSSERKIAPGQLTLQQMRDLYRVDTIDDKTRIFGVVADPVVHSMSPLIFNTAFREDNVNARYIPFRIPPEDLELFVRWSRLFGIGGLSITLPHKETIIPMLHVVEAAAQGIAAVNTVVFNADEAIGYNTDYRGAMDCLVEAMREFTGDDDPFRGRTVLLLGAGGVAHAIAYGLRQRGAHIEIAARTLPHGEALAKRVGGRCVPWNHRHDIKAACIVNCTPIGMFPDVESTPYDGSRLERNTLIFDTVYNPESTLFVKDARKAKCHVLTGSYMFIRQAYYQYKAFTGLEPPGNVMRAVLAKAISPINY